MLQVKENRLIYQDNQILLRGVSVADVNHIKGFRTFTFEEILDKAIDTFKINTIRIPILPESKCKDSWYDVPDYFSNALNPAVEYALSKGLFVILDSHYICEFYKKPHFWNKNRDWNRKLKHDLMYFWDFLSKKYCNQEKIIYEIFNEPIGPKDWSRYKIKIANVMITVIRNNCPNLILVGRPSPCDVLDVFENPMYQANVLHSTHLYPSFLTSNWKEHYKLFSDKHPLVIVEWGFQNGIIGGDNIYADELLAFSRKENISLISGFADPYWEPSLFYEDLSLTELGKKVHEFYKL